MSEQMPEQKKEIELKKPIEIGAHRAVHKELDKSETGLAQGVPVAVTTQVSGTGGTMTDLRRDDAREEIARDVAAFVEQKGKEITAKPANTAWVQGVITDEMHRQRQKTTTVESQVEIHDTVQKQVEEVTLTPLQEMQRIHETMHNIKDRAFVPVNRPAERTGKWGKFKNRLKVGARWIMSATIGLGGAVYGYFSDSKKRDEVEKEKLPKAQSKRQHEYVPGRGMEKFLEEDGTKEVYSDVRRGPLVWEKLTAGDPEEPPEIAILVEQSQRGSSAALDSEELGHTMIGLTYSRYNPSTRRKERYQIRMGFYPGGGMVNQTGTIAMAGGAIMTGSLQNDAGHHYDIARRYQVTNEQINKVLRAAETYADGGYGYYQRNCTTFAIDMAKEAGLEIGKLEKDEMRFVNGTWMKQEFGQSLAAYSYYGGASIVAGKMDKDDLSYMNYGQKMATKEDLDRYYETAMHENIVREGYSPGALGEVLRSSDEGEIDAFYLEHRGKTQMSISDAVNDTGEKLWDEISKYIPADKMTEEDRSFKKLVAQRVRFDNKFQMSTDELRELHKTMSLRIKAVSEYYRNRLGSDSRLSVAVLDYMGICEAYLTYVNTAYIAKSAEETPGDAAPLTGKFIQGAFTLSFTDENGVEQKAGVSPAMYEGFLMAKVPPAEIVRIYNDRDRIQRINEDDRSYDEDRRLNECLRLIELAEDFASANRYLLWKQNYTAEDLKYAFFDLKEKERDFGEDAAAYGDLLNEYTPSRIYRASIYEKIFDGLQKEDTCLTGITDLDKDAMDEYLTRKAEASQDRMFQIIDCYLEKYKGDFYEDICAQIIDDFTDDYIRPMYKGTDVPEDVQNNVILHLKGLCSFGGWMEAAVEGRYLESLDKGKAK